MSDNVTLTAAVRSSLLSLQNTTDLINRTNNRLSSGLKVASAIDDPVAYFQAKGLNDRSSDFTEKKASIDQGLSTLTAATDGIDGVDSIVRQLKGVAQSMKSASGSAFTDLITQYNSLRTQLGLLADDATYQGTNLVNNTTEKLEISFSNETGSLITINAVNVRQSGLGINTLGAAATNSFTFSGYAASNLQALTTSGNDTITLTYKGTTQTFATTAQAVSFTLGTTTVTIYGNSQAAVTLSAGDTVQVRLQTGYGSAACTGAAAVASTLLYGVATAGSFAAAAEASTTDYVIEGNSTSINSLITTLDSALTTLRTQSQTLGNNVALLQTRLDFTEGYVNTLETGASKLNLADINEEGANLLALQTRQQLGISALSFAGRAEQGILSLFQ